MEQIGSSWMHQTRWLKYCCYGSKQQYTNKFATSYRPPILLTHQHHEWPPVTWLVRGLVTWLCDAAVDRTKELNFEAYVYSPRLPFTLRWLADHGKADIRGPSQYIQMDKYWQRKQQKVLLQEGLLVDPEVIYVVWPVLFQRNSLKQPLGLPQTRIRHAQSSTPDCLLKNVNGRSLLLKHWLVGCWSFISLYYLR